jgi:RNA-directed DNA polymerase
VPGALAEAVRLLTPAGNKPPPFGFALPLDIANCFDEIDHRLLEEQLAACVSDPDVCRLLGVLLAAGGKEVGCLWWRRACGLVQGSTLSPLLCNLALQPLDEALADAGRQRGGDVVLLRYADDLLLLGRDSRAAHQGLSVVQAALSRLRLALRNPVPLLRPVVEGFNWLGVTVCPRASYGHGRMIFGYVIPTDRVTRMLERLDEMTVPPSERIEAGAFNLSRWVVSINAQLRDWHQAYRFADNALDVFRAVDDHARGRLGAMLGSILGKRWTDLRRQYARHLPRGFWTWEVDGCRLTLLSALAPHSPANLQHRPAWMRAATGGGGSRSNSHGERPPLVSNKPAPANGHDDGASPPPPDLAPAPGSLLITPPDLRS